MTTALVIKIVLPLSLLAALSALYATYKPKPTPPHWNARQQAMINSLRTARVKGDR